MPSIDPARFLADLHALRRIGEYKTGVHRPTYSAVDMQARRYVVARLAEAGLVADIDGIGNVLGRDPSPGPHLLLGSHLETQNHAGWLDGVLGVVAGLEVARALGRGIDVAAWADEEGHYLGFPGSRSFIGDLTEAEITAARNRYDGTPMRDALAAAGLAGRPRATFAPGRWRGFLEMHIEQGDDLEARGLRLGVVTSIVAIWQYRIVFTGQQNHAGTTRMAARRDAGLAAVRLAAAIDRRFPEICAPRSVWTVGRITLDPGAPSIIPGRAEMLFQFRDADPVVLARMAAELETLVAEAARGPCTVVLEPMARATPMVCDATLQAALEKAAEARAPRAHQRMPSGAGHDAQYLARVMPAAMLFVPSIGGISHHWTEDTREDDLVLGCQVLADAAAALLAA